MIQVLRVRLEPMAPQVPQEPLVCRDPQVLEDLKVTPDQLELQALMALWERLAPLVLEVGLHIDSFTECLSL